MNYYFTGILIVMLTLLAFCAGPAYPRNEYLNSYPNECRTGEVDMSVSRRDYDYNNYDNSWNGSESEEVRLTFRKYLGNLQCNERNDLALENERLKQQLELMKMCGRVNSNPSLALNENFALLVSKCRGVTPARDNTRPADSQSLWDDMKDEYKKENPDVKLMGDKFIKPSKKKLIIPKYLTEEGSVILPLPKPKSEEEEWNEIE